MDTLALLEKELQSKYEGSPQRQTLCALALADIRSALSSLGHLGHHYDLIESEQTPPQEFPKMFYHSDGKQTLVVHDPAVAEGLSDDWHERPIQSSQDAENALWARQRAAGTDATSSPEGLLSIDADGNPVLVQGEKTTPILP